MHKHILATVALCLWVFLCGALIVYMFPAPREAVLRLLSAADAASLSTAVPAGAATTTPTGEAITYGPLPIYQYKLLQNVDPCTLTQLGAAGWSASQFSTDLVSVGGADASCTTKGNYQGFDWILFTRTYTPNVQSTDISSTSAAGN